MSDQIRRLATQNPFQLAGQFANLDFWLDEANAAVKILRNYNKRFTKLKEGTEAWIANHGSLVLNYCAMCEGPCELEKVRSAPPPERVPSKDRGEAETGVREAVRLLVLRMYRNHLIDEDRLRGIGDQFEFGFEPKDLRRPEKDEHVEPMVLFRKP